MPDICMCKGEGCPVKDQCFRNTAKDSEYQAFFTEIPYDKEKLECEYFWQNKNKKEDESNI